MTLSGASPGAHPGSSACPRTPSGSSRDIYIYIYILTHTLVFEKNLMMFWHILDAHILIERIHHGRKVGLRIYTLCPDDIIPKTKAKAHIMGGKEATA